MGNKWILSFNLTFNVLYPPLLRKQTSSSESLCCFNVSPWTSAKESTKSCLQGGITPGTVTQPRQMSAKQLCKNGSGNPGGQQADHEPASSPCSEGDQQPPRVHRAALPAGQGRSSFPLLSTSDTPRSRMLRPIQERQGLCGAGPAKGYREDEGTGASVIQGETESCACSALVKRRPRVTRACV